MTTPEPADDAALEARIRAAAEVPFEADATTGAVLARVRKVRAVPPAPRRTGWLAWAGPAAFASVLVATPLVVAYVPAPDDTLLIGLATGDPRAILGGILE